MALIFQTKHVTFAAPLDLSGDTDVAVRGDQLPQYTYVENTGTTRLYWRETTASPDPAVDRGHILEVGAAIIALVYEGRSFWIWGTDGGEVTLSPAAPQPTRDT